MYCEELIIRVKSALGSSCDLSKSPPVVYWEFPREQELCQASPRRGNQERSGLFLLKGQKGSGLFLWPPSRSDSGFQAKTNCCVLDPVVVSEGEAAAVAEAEGG